MQNGDQELDLVGQEEDDSTAIVLIRLLLTTDSIRRGLAGAKSRRSGCDDFLPKALKVNCGTAKIWLVIVGPRDWIQSP